MWAESGLVQDTASTTIQSGEEGKGILNTQEERMTWSVAKATARMIVGAVALGANSIVGTTVAVKQWEGGASRWCSTGAVIMGTAMVGHKKLQRDQ